MNGAAEAILEELLAQSRAQTQILQQLARAFTGSSGGSGGGGGGAAGVVASFSALNVATRAISVLFNGLSNIVSSVFKLFGSIVGSAVNVVEAFDKLGQTALTTGAKLSDFFKALESIPVIGKVFDFFGGLIRNQEMLLESYRALSKSGVTFSGNLLDLVQAAGKTSLTLTQLQSVLGENREAFARLGAGNVQEGFSKFVAAQDRLMGPDSTYRKQILGLGVTAEEAAGFIGTLTRSQGIMGRNREIDEAKLAKQTGEYIIQLDALNRLTGIAKEQMDATIKKAQDDQQWQLFMDGLTEDQKIVADQMITAASAFGPEAVEEVKARLRNLDVPVTEFGSNLAAFTGGAILQGENLRKTLFSATKDTNGFSAALQFLGGAAENLGGFLKSVPAELLASGALKNIPPAMISFERAIREKGLAAALKEIEEQQRTAAEGTAARNSEAQLRVQRLGLAIASVSGKIQEVFAPIILELSSGMAELVEGLVGVVDELISSDGFKETVKAVTNWFKTAFVDISNAFKEGGLKGGLTTMFDKLAEGFSTMWDVVKGPIKSAFMSLIEWLKPYFGDLMDSILGGVSDWIYQKTGYGTAPEIRKLEDKMASVLRHAEYAAMSSPENTTKIKTATDQQIVQLRGDLIEKLLSQRAGKTDVNGRLDYLPEIKDRVANEVDSMIAEFRSDYASRLEEATALSKLPTETLPGFIRRPESDAMVPLENAPNFQLQLNMLNELKTFNSNMETQNRILRGMNGNLYQQ